MGSILLLRPPFFTPLSPPLGLACLRAALVAQNHFVRCFDFNTDSDLWSLRQEYFDGLLPVEMNSGADGQTHLWLVLNAHLLAVLNEAGSASSRRVVETITKAQCLEPQIEFHELDRIARRIFDRVSQLNAELDFTSFDIVGTSTYSTSLATSLYILKFAKETCPQIRTVMGGGVFADDLAPGSENLATLLNEYAYVDHTVIGEGETPLVALASGKVFDDKVLSLASVGAQAVDLSLAPPPDYEDFDLRLYFDLSIEGGRSCPFQCTFCSETVQWGRYRRRPPRLLADQMITLARRYNRTSFFMGDSLINPYIDELASHLDRYQEEIAFDGYLRADEMVTDPRRTMTWARSGLRRVRIGVESASTNVLDRMAKKTTPSSISRALRALATAGIRTTTYWIVGFPGETETDFQSTLQFIREHHIFIYELEAHPFAYYPFGQIGSGTHSAIPAFPDDVNTILRFKEWEACDVTPKRADRFLRLKHISKLAADLGIPNIYSMQQRHAAEKRWQTLHPLAQSSESTLDGLIRGRWHRTRVARPASIEGSARFTFE